MESDPMRAPWSYEEVIGAIGLRAMYQQAVNFALTNGVKMPSEKEWIASVTVVALQPSMYIRALQAGVVLQPVRAQLAAPLGGLDGNRKG